MLSINEGVSGTTTYTLFPNSKLLIRSLAVYDTATILNLTANNATFFWTKTSPNGGQYTRKTYLMK
jgi:hypothetical protein